MEFKKLETQPEHKGITAVVKSPHFRKSIVAILVGALAGFGYFYFTNGRHMDAWIVGDYMQSILLGGFLGFFLTNSPCARNQC